ncbi:MAG: twin-arginine translocase TatA/TatE family subunit [Phycisphaerales bacterium]|nr:twin-arginine translocase TatA/TatE family subunit [Planctomycetota bacterium]MBL6997414.1 twin-arginine translocase TatA/TatE family subunit [Phycisphaerales bacterium]
MPGWAEIAVLLVIGLLIFGKRLPEVGRNLGKSIVEFKKGIKGIGDDIDSESEKKASELEESKSADLPPAKVTPDPAKEADIKIEEAKHHLDD